jgi:hypothetical protein
MLREESPRAGNQEALEMKNKPFRDRLGLALNGLQEAWRRQRSLRTQTYIGAIAVVVTIASLCLFSPGYHALARMIGQKNEIERGKFSLLPRT